MRLLVVIIILISLGLFGLYSSMMAYPYKLFSSWLDGENYNKFYSITNFRSILLAPNENDTAKIKKDEKYNEDYPLLWKEFRLGSAFLSLPVRHPLMLPVPFVKYDENNKTTFIGFGIHSPDSRKMVSIYFIPSIFRDDYSFGQDLFKLPFFQNKIKLFDSPKVWKDIFSFQLTKYPKTLDDMIYDLFILHIRSKLLPLETVNYGLYDEDTGFIEFKSKDKDYKNELILKRIGKRVYSYVIETSLENKDAEKLKYKFLKEIQFKFLDLSYSKVVYTEFKQLNFSRQLDAEGILYLFSAWSQDFDQVELLKEIIYHSERGKKYQNGLKSFYEYAFKKYKKTFSTKDSTDLNDDPNLNLQRRIEVENVRKLKEAESAEANVIKQVLPTIEEKQKLELKKAKENSEEKTGELTVY